MAIITPTNPGGLTDAYPNLNAAYAGAADGDIIDISPTGSNWSGTYYFNNVINTSKLVSLKGPGKASIIFTRNDSTPDATVLGWLYMIRYNINSNSPCNISVSGITFRSKTPSVNDGSDGLSMVADRGLGFLNAVDFKVNDCRFEYFGDGGLEVRHRDYLARGLVYNCEFHKNVKGATGLGLGYGLTVYGEGLNWWPNAGKTMGGPDFIFIEDCTFNYHRHAVATAGGSRHVIRYCTVGFNGINLPFSQALDTHDSRGPGNGTNTFGSRVWEVYNNTVVNTTFKDGVTPVTNGSSVSNVEERAIGALSGDGVIHNNTCSGYRFMIGIRQNENSVAPYPWLQQGGWISGRRLGTSHSGTDPIAGDGDFYEWNNTFTPYVSTPSASSQKVYVYEPAYYTAGRDYHVDTPKPGYTPFTYPHPKR